MTINCKRAEQVAFSTAYFQAGPAGPGAQGVDDRPATTSRCKGKRVCTAEGSTAYDALDEKSFGAVFEDEHDGTERTRTS